MFKSMFAMAVVAFISFPLKAEPAGSHIFIDGNRLYADCNRDSNDAAGLIAFGACRNYIFGVFDSFVAFRSENKLSACLPEGVNAGQLVDIVRQHLRDNPARRHEGASYMVVRAVLPLLTQCQPKN